ncbi:MAG: ArsR/SmtB family transcription factor [bacterium]
MISKKEETINTNKVFAALADGNRRKIIELVHESETTLLALAEEFSISFQALSKHIKILESAKILQKEKQGKYRVLRLNKEALEPTLKWISHYSDFWNQSFDKLGEEINKSNERGE